MKIENNIGWCDETGNKVTGCDKVSPGCKNCYAAVGTRARVLRAQGIETWGPKGQRYPVADFSKKVRRLNKLCVCDKCHTASPAKYAAGERCECGGELRRIRIFADSNSDWLDDKWPIETLADLLKDIHDCPNIDFQLLTKRPENFQERLTAVLDERCLAKYPTPDFAFEFAENWLESNAGNSEAHSPANVWLGVSVEDQKRADERIPLLLEIPAKVRFLSVEPLLSSVRLPLVEYCEKCNRSGFINGTAESRTHCCGSGIGRAEDGIHWVIVGGESGSERRDCGTEAICDVARQCVAAGIPCFVKQASAHKPGQRGDLPDEVWALKQFPA